MPGAWRKVQEITRMEHELLEVLKPRRHDDLTIVLGSRLSRGRD
jgi:hypothetical protein